MTPSAARSGRRLGTQQELLAAIRVERTTTKADLSRLTGLSRSAITEAVQSLIAERPVSKPTPATRWDGVAGDGRPG